MDLKLILIYTTIVFIVVNILMVLFKNIIKRLKYMKSERNIRRYKIRIMKYIYNLEYSKIIEDFNISFIDDILEINNEYHELEQIDNYEKTRLKQYAYMYILYRREMENDF